MNLWILGFGWLGNYLHHKAKQNNICIAAVSRDANKAGELRKNNISPILVTKENDFIPEYIPFLPDVAVLSTPPAKDHASFTNWCAYLKGIHSTFKRAGCTPLWIYTSSTGIYPDESGMFDENFPIAPSTTRQKYLFMHEQELQNQIGEQLCIARLGGLVGGERNAIRFYHQHVSRFHALEPVNMIHGEDAAGFIIYAAQNQLSGIYNVCHPHHPTREKFYRDACLEHGVEPREMIRTGDFKNRIISSEKMLNSGFTPQKNI